MPITFRGAYTAIVTPFSDDGSTIDFARLDEHIAFQARGGVTGIVPCGTTGESPTLSESEQHAVIERAIAVGKPLGLQIVAGTGSNCTAHAVEMHRFAHKAGADASLQVSPYYNKPSQEGLYRHFMTLADKVELPIVLYNIPGRTGITMTPQTVARLNEHPNVVAIKEATGSLDMASEIMSLCDITVVSGDDSLTLPLMSIGGKGVISVASNLLPAQVKQLQDGVVQGLIAQLPAEIGAKGVEQAVAAVKGQQVTASIPTGATIVTKENLAKPEVQKTLYKAGC